MQTHSKALLEKLFDIKVENSPYGSAVHWIFNNTEFNLKQFKVIIVLLEFEYSLSGDEQILLQIKQPSKIIDKFENKMIQTLYRCKAKKYKYISQLDKQGAEGAGAISLYTMLPSLAISIGLSLVLYFSF